MDRRNARKAVRVPRRSVRPKMVADDTASGVRVRSEDHTMNNIVGVPLAVRAYPQSPKPPTKPDRRTWRRSPLMLVFDTETRTDATQRLTFGSYRFISDGRCLEEELFYADDLPPKDRAVLQRYVRRHRADVHKSGARDLKLLTRG